MKRMNNETGSVTLISLILFLTLFMSSLFIILQNLKTLRRVNERSQNYLCLKSIIAKTINLDQFILKTNTIIAINYPLQFNPKTGPIHKAIVETTKLTQEARLKKSQFEIMSMKSCSLTNKLSTIRFLNLNTKSGAILNRNINQTAITNPTSFTIYYDWNSKTFEEKFKNEKISILFERTQAEKLQFNINLKDYSL